MANLYCKYSITVLCTLLDFYQCLLYDQITKGALLITMFKHPILYRWLLAIMWYPAANENTPQFTDKHFHNITVHIISIAGSF